MTPCQIVSCVTGNGKLNRVCLLVQFFHKSRRSIYTFVHYCPIIQCKQKLEKLEDACILRPIEICRHVAFVRI
jgi:hypothetical protein